MNLLFITESPRFFDWLSSELKGHTCVHASAIEQAAELMGTQKFDAVFLDPYIHGEMMESAAYARALCKCPLILLTGSALRADISSLCDGIIYSDSMHPATEIPKAIDHYTTARKDANFMDRTTELFNALKYISPA